jgi:amidohydrolase
MDLDSSLLEEARSLLAPIVTLRRRIHRHPELGTHLPETQRLILEALDDLELEVSLGRGLSSIVAAIHGTEPGPTVLLRADMDALPMPEDTGLEYSSEIPCTMHACGHDSHVAMLVGAARLLTKHRDRLRGRVLLTFQPGEEGHGGALQMISEGLLENPKPDAAFALHVWPGLASGRIATRSGAIMASSDDFEIVIHGRGGHASMPHDALDPVPIACEVVTAIQSFVTRRLNAFDPGLVTIGKIEAGTTFNVIPESARMLGTFRAVSEKTRRMIREGLPRLVEGICQAHGAAATVQVVEGYPVTVNDDPMAQYSVEKITWRQWSPLAPQSDHGSRGFFLYPTKSARCDGFSRRKARR